MSDIDISISANGGVAKSHVSGSGSGGKIAYLMKKIVELQKQAAKIKGSPEEVAKQVKALDQQIKLIEMQIQQILAQEAQNQQTQASKVAEKSSGAQLQSLKLHGGNIIDTNA